MDRDHDPRLELIYQEALRGLLQQRSEVESLRGRAGTLIFAASFAGSLLGGRALADGIGPWDWAALGLLVAIGGLAAGLLWPYYDLAYRFDPEDLIMEYIDADPPASIASIHWALALRLKADWRHNGRTVRRMREALQSALLALIAMMLAWMVSIAGG